MQDCRLALLLFSVQSVYCPTCNPFIFSCSCSATDSSRCGIQVSARCMNTLSSGNERLEMGCSVAGHQSLFVQYLPIHLKHLPNAERHRLGCSVCRCGRTELGSDTPSRHLPNKAGAPVTIIIINLCIVITIASVITIPVVILVDVVLLLFILL